MNLALFNIFVGKFTSGFLLLFYFFYCPCLVLVLRLFLPLRIYWRNVPLSSSLQKDFYKIGMIYPLKIWQNSLVQLVFIIERVKYCLNLFYKDRTIKDFCFFQSQFSVLEMCPFCLHFQIYWHKVHSIFSFQSLLYVILFNCAFHFSSLSILTEV